VKYFSVFFLCLTMSIPLFSKEVTGDQNLEISGGFALTLYQSVYSFQQSAAFETAVMKEITPGWNWQAGARLGLSPARPEGFFRLLAAQQIGIWRPLVGIETGITNRARFDEGEKLLRETRQAMEDGISHFYVAGYAAPLSFHIKNRWRISAFELQFGTHIGHTGRTARLQISVLSIGIAL